jgi:hypothetical protein
MNKDTTPTPSSMQEGAKYRGAVVEVRHPLVTQ